MFEGVCFVELCVCICVCVHVCGHGIPSAVPIKVNEFKPVGVTM